MVSSLIDIAQQTRQASQSLASMPTDVKNGAIAAIARSLNDSAAEILAANRVDCLSAQALGISPSLFARLKLDEVKLASAIAGMEEVIRLPDPVGIVQLHRQLDTHLVLQRITCPLGVLGVIFEARPDAVMQITSLAIKSGNGVILKGGVEATQSCQALVLAIQRGLAQTNIDPKVIQLLTSREETLALLTLHDDVNLIIPRGSNSFVQFVQQNTSIPVLGHADGICHLYVDRAADIEQAVAIAVDSKVQYPSACNAIETLLVHGEIAPLFLPRLATALQLHGVELRLDKVGFSLLQGGGWQLKLAEESDWATEYGDLILAIRVVDSLEAALTHIQVYGSRHTEAIVTQDSQAAAIFRDRVDASGVFHNWGTRFADGFRYGFGAEVGISTQTLPPRGPVGLEGLVTYKYHLTGQGQVVSTYSGANAQPFHHRDL